MESGYSSHLGFAFCSCCRIAFLSASGEGIFQIACNLVQYSNCREILLTE